MSRCTSGRSITERHKRELTISSFLPAHHAGYHAIQVTDYKMAETRSMMERVAAHWSAVGWKPHLYKPCFLHALYHAHLHPCHSPRVAALLCRHTPYHNERLHGPQGYPRMRRVWLMRIGSVGIARCCPDDRGAPPPPLQPADTYLSSSHRVIDDNDCMHHLRYAAYHNHNLPAFHLRLATAVRCCCRSDHAYLL
jgi:hypothetical protein